MSEPMKFPKDAQWHEDMAYAFETAARAEERQT